jgi:hypothetical protein
MNSDKDLDRAEKDLRKQFKDNHQKVLHDFYRAYLAKCYEQGESVDLRDYVLNHEIVREEGKLRNKYWITKKVAPC